MADPQWLRVRSSQLRGRADETRQLSRLVREQASMCWVSPAASRFRGQVETRAEALMALAADLDEAADRLDSHARGIELDRVLLPAARILVGAVL